MKLTLSHYWGVVGASIAAAILVLTLSNPAAAQIVPPERNALDVGVIPVYGTTIYTAGFSHRLNSALDLTAGYVYETSSGNTASLLDAGFRYHFPSPTSRVDFYLSGGYSSVNASASMSFGNFTASGSGYNVGAGTSLHLTRAFEVYASASYLSFGGLGSVGFYDVGLQFQVVPYVSARVGALALSSGGSIGGGPYLGLNLIFP
jgi:hypothetical protein